jgi:hypothetical protein
MPSNSGLHPTRFALLLFPTDVESWRVFSPEECFADTARGRVKPSAGC